MMTYQKTLDFLYSKLPMFTRIGAAALKKDLHNTIEMCAALGDPQNKIKTIHVAGTNGKGSTSHMLAAILQQSGYRTGLYTSPHLKDFRERIKINGKMVSKSFVTNFVESQKNTIKQLQPSFFEVTVAMAFDYFEKEKVDIAVIEVGLGGRLDSTNIITPVLSIITNISLDHTNILGSTLPEIAFEKAGIIKKSIPLVIGEKHPETITVFTKKAETEKAPLYFAEEELTAKNIELKTESMVLDIVSKNQTIFSKLILDLTGTYQLKNVLAVITAAQQLKSLGFSIPDDAVYSGLKNVKKLTGLHGRWETIARKPLVICDTGHNEAGIKEVLKNIAATKFEQLHFVIGMVKDKDVDGVLALLPKKAIYYFTQPALERALPAHELADLAAKFKLKGEIFDHASAAFENAVKMAGSQDLVFVGGSTFVVAEIL